MSRASTRTMALLASAEQVAIGWGPTAGRILLGLVLAWFGYHELMQPSLWTGYVPLIGRTSALATILVLGHGWLLLVLAVALVGRNRASPGGRDYRNLDIADSYHPYRYRGAIRPDHA